MISMLKTAIKPQKINIDKFEISRLDPEAQVILLHKAHKVTIPMIESNDDTLN